MPLSKQLLLLISALFLLMFCLNFGLSIAQAKAYLQVEARNHAQDTATSLGLSLSPYMHQPQDQMIKTMTSAIFDRGYYREIRLLDAEHREVLALRNDKVAEDLPSWFVALLPIVPATAASEISSGWQPSGVVYVTVNNAFAYSKLYQLAVNSLMFSSATLVLAIALLTIILKLTLASLKQIDLQAQAIADGRFEVLEPLPWTREVRNVGQSMNLMSQKIAGSFRVLNQQLASLGASLQCDDLTGLYKRAVFETDLLRLLCEHRSGYFLLLKVDSLPELIKRRGDQTIDQLLRAVADALSRQFGAAGHCYRFYGGEFACLLEPTLPEAVELMADGLTAELARLGAEQDQVDLAHLGIVPVIAVDSAFSLVEAAHEACRQAQMIGANRYYLSHREHSVRDIAEWTILISRCIAQADYALLLHDPVQPCAGGPALMEEAFVQARDPDGQSIDPASLVVIAEKLEKIAELDRGVIVKTLQRIDEDAIAHAIAVNLATASVKNPAFRSWLQALLQGNADARRQLVFSFSAYAVAKNLPVYREFFEQLRQWGGAIMIKRFESQSLSPEQLQQLKPNYLRLSRELSNNIGNVSSQRQFIQAILHLADLLGFAVLAENVKSDSDLAILQAMGIVGASR